MADHTHIEWTDATWNPITGCSIVSPGCADCYAMRLAGTRLAHHPSRAGLTREVNGHHVWTGEVRLNEQWLTQPLLWRRPRRIFVCAHGDLFHAAVPDEWIDRVFAVMALAPQHTFQVLTKRSARMREYIGDSFGARRAVAMEVEAVQAKVPTSRRTLTAWPLPNVWLGVSAERQQEADARIPDLLATPAAVRFVSAEPLLSHLDLSKWLNDGRRESIPSASGPRPFQSRDGRNDLAPSQMDGRRIRVGANLHTEGTGGAERGGAGQLPQSDVQGRPGPAKGDGTSNRLDDREQATHPSRHGNQPSRWPQAEQQAAKPRTGHPPAERAALAHSSFTKEERSARREELGSRSDGNAGHGDPRDLGQPRFIAAGDCCEVRDHPIDGIGDCDAQELGAPALNWVIVGGESGPGARPMHTDWARSIRDQCVAAGVPYFFKQNGAWEVAKLGDRGARWLADDGWLDTETPEYDPPFARHHTAVSWVLVAPVGKSRAGRLLDGRTWDEMPAQRQPATEGA